MTSASSVIKALLTPPGLRPFRARGAAAIAVTGAGNELAIFVQSLRWAPPGEPEFIVSYGVRLRVLVQFDQEQLGIKHAKWPRLGRLHYERSLGWLMGQEEPVFSGAAGGDAVAVKLRPLIQSFVLPDLLAHDSEGAVARSLLQSDPLSVLTLDDLQRLRYLLRRSGTVEQRKDVDAAIRELQTRTDLTVDDQLIEDVNEEIARVTGARIVRRHRN